MGAPDRAHQTGSPQRDAHWAPPETHRVWMDYAYTWFSKVNKIVNSLRVSSLTTITNGVLFTIDL